MKRETLEGKTVAELREMVNKQEIEGRSGLTTKDQLIDALADDAATTEAKQAKAQKPNTTRNPAQFPLAGMTIEHSEGKGEKRLFQPSPDKKVFMNKEEAEAAGHYWADTEAEVDRNVKDRA